MFVSAFDTDLNVTEETIDEHVTTQLTDITISITRLVFWNT